MASNDEYQQHRLFKKEKFIQINCRFNGHKPYLINNEIKCEDGGSILWYSGIDPYDINSKSRSCSGYSSLKPKNK